ncbi:MAG: UPF0149 family protein [Gammaproteobacteria bacterium]
MNKRNVSTALTDDELDRLAVFLDQFPGAMNLEAIDGFFCALICAPDMVPMDEVMSRVWGEQAEFASDDEAKEITSLLMRHWNMIVTTLSNDDFYHPILLEDEAGNVSANDWAQAFCGGMELSGGSWPELLGDEEKGGCIVPILILAHEYDPDPEMRSDIVDNAQREDIIGGMIVGLKKIYDYFAPHRRALAQAHSATTTYRRRVQKVGRNDPCPCGSGRKYKQCCAGQNPRMH